MPQQQTVQNNFKEGFKTEFTGLNFPENAATDTQNCIYSYVGDVSRRGGINYELNYVLSNPGLIQISNTAKSTFRWLNAGGDGQTQILVEQIGSTLYFFLSSSATLNNPLSSKFITSTVSLTSFQSSSNPDPSLLECQYAIGNGYLFIFHPNCDPFYCTYNNGLITASAITLQIRDTVGIPEPGIADNFRPTTLSNEHLYNLLNQGWTQGSGWSGIGSFNGTVPLSNSGTGITSMTVAISSQSATNVVVPGDQLKLNLSPCSGTGPDAPGNPTGSVTLIGAVTNYTTSTVTLTISSNSAHNLDTTGFWSGGNFFPGPASVSMSLVNQGFINAWQSALKNYPSNADIWWLYKDTTNAFNPSATFANVQSTTTPAPKGSFLLNVFNQDRSSTSSIANLTPVFTIARPSTGAFYQGRVWYAGVNASQIATGDEPYITWTENIYFSQIIESPVNFGRCYQANDPTSQDLNALLPSDGGVISIPGCGAIYKLFTLRFGLLVFAANGIWFISGSTGIGFTADDFSVIKISSIKAMSGSSFVDMQSYPMFWNQEGIYLVTPPAQAGSAHSPDIQLDVKNLCIGTILSYYSSIPLLSKTYTRGDYDPINYIVQWCFRSTEETGIVDRYKFDSILNFNVVTQAFYPFSLPSNSQSYITDIRYIDYPGGSSNGLTPQFKYTTVVGPSITFSEENDFTSYVDFKSENGQGHDFTSFFITGYMLPGQALRKVQIPYVYLFSRNPLGSKCSMQAIWDYVTSTVSGKQSTRQVVTMGPNSLYRKIRLRGRGMAVQIKVSSISGQPFDIMGWSVLDQVNQVV